MGLADLLGDTLVMGDGKTTVPTSEALAGKKAVGLYFSAHWCGPCRGFTPKLVDIYKQVCAAHNSAFEIVFVSSDRDEPSFGEYFAEMPWLALPYSDRALKQKLSQKYGVQGIPSLVILDSEGATITKDGREAVMEHGPEGFPWVPPTLEECLGTSFKSKRGDDVTLAELQKEGKYIALYFSAHWCPPCRGFTPELTKAYNNAKKANKPLEIIFVSSDRDANQFNEYFNEMGDWLAIEAGDPRKSKLSTHFGVSGIPSLIVLAPDLTVVNDDARGMVGNDIACEKFPWKPPLVRDVEDITPDLQNKPSVVVFMEEAGERWDELEEVLTTLAKAEGEEKEVTFWTCQETGGGIGSQLRKLTELPQRPKMGEVTCIMLDLSDEGGYYKLEGDVTSESLGAFVQGYKNKSLTRLQVKKP